MQVARTLRLFATLVSVGLVVGGGGSGSRGKGVRTTHVTPVVGGGGSGSRGKGVRTTHVTPEEDYPTVENGMLREGPLDDGIRYARLDMATLEEATTEQAMRRRDMQSLPVVLVITSYGWPPKFDLSWVNRQPWPAFVSTKEPGKRVHSEPWGNIGQEDATYFRFITMFWNDLPERMVFLHGHNKAWHQEGYLMEYLLRNACFNSTLEYFSLNGPPVVRAPKGAKANEWQILRKYWEPLGMGRLGKLPPRGLREKCCAQFMVHRNRVQRHPKDFYEVQRQEMTDPGKTYLRSMKVMNVHVGFDLVLFYESIWHVMWGEKPWMSDEMYGTCIDHDIERDHSLGKKIMNKQPSRCMRRVIGCDKQPLCMQSPTCSAAVRKASGLPLPPAPESAENEV